MDQSFHYSTINSHDFIDKILFHGYTLHERINDFIESKLFSDDLSISSSCDKNSILEWQAVFSVNKNVNHFHTRLEFDNLRETDLPIILNQSPQSRYPNWYIYFNNLLKNSYNQHTIITNWSEIPDICLLPFFHIWIPVVDTFIESLKSNLLFVNHIEDQIWTQLGIETFKLLSEHSAPALFYLFEKRLTLGQIFVRTHNLIVNEPIPNIEYNEFINNVIDSEFVFLFDSFPVLYRLLSTTLHNWENNLTNILTRTFYDQHDLVHTFGVACFEKICSISFNSGDTHNAGQSVVIIHYPNLKLVYKPRDMTLDTSFQAFIFSCNHHFTHHPLKVLSVLQRNGYGYMEFVDQIPPLDFEDKRSLYYNFGRLISILHLLGTTDCHYENLIVHSNQLVLVDCETLFEPSINSDNSELLDNISGVNQELLLMFNQSIIQTLLLPRKIYIKNFQHKKIAFEISGLSSVSESHRAESALGYDYVNTDYMKLRTTIHNDTSSTLDISIDKITAPYSSFTNDIQAGFSDQSNCFMSAKHFFLDNLNRFINNRRRIVLRPTRVYHIITKELVNPMYLSSFLNQGLRIEQLAKAWINKQSSNKNWEIFRAECEQVQILDIPYFSHLVNTRNLDLFSNLSMITEYFSTSGLDKANDRLNILSHDEIQHQLFILKGTLNTSSLETVTNIPFNTNTTFDSSSFDTTSFPIAPHYQEFAYQFGVDLFSRRFSKHDCCLGWYGYCLGDDSLSLDFGPLDSCFHTGLFAVSSMFSLLNKCLDADRSSIFGDYANTALVPFNQLMVSSDDLNLFRFSRNKNHGIRALGGIFRFISEFENSIDFDTDLWLDRLINSLSIDRLLASQDYSFQTGILGLFSVLTDLSFPSYYFDDLLLSLKTHISIHTSDFLSSINSNRELINYLNYSVKYSSKFDDSFLISSLNSSFINSVLTSINQYFSTISSRGLLNTANIIDLIGYFQLSSILSTHFNCTSSFRAQDFDNLILSSLSHVSFDNLLSNQILISELLRIHDISSSSQSICSFLLSKQYELLTQQNTNNDSNVFVFNNNYSLYSGCTSYVISLASQFSLTTSSFQKNYLSDFLLS